MSLDIVLATPGYITMTAGGAASMGTGAYTVAALFNLKGANSGIWSGYTSAPAMNRDILTDTGHLYGQSDFSAGFGTMSTGVWYLGIVSKAAGSSLYQYHLWPYASDGSGTMTDGGTGQSTGDGAALATMRLGDAENNTVKGNCLAAVWGLWNRKLTDPEAQTLKSGALSAWAALSPAELIHAANWDGTNGSSITVAVGTSTFVSKSGTVSVGANPPGFNFSLGSSFAAGQRGALAMFM